MRIALLLVLLAVMPSFCQAGPPPFFSQETIDPASFAQAVNYYVALGRGPAVHELSKLAKENGLRVSWVCRVLFQPKKANQILRGPEAGSLIDLPPTIPVDTMPEEKWPLFPVAEAGKSYFILGYRYLCVGVPEDPRDYLSFCRSYGRFREDPIPVPNRTEAGKDALALRHSSAWKAVKWSSHKNGDNYDYEPSVWAFVKTQAEAVHDTHEHLTKHSTR